MMFLLDQNVPRSVKDWLTERLPGYTVQHTSETGLFAASDREIYEWAFQHQAVIITFDYDFIEDFVNQQRVGIIHLRANPTSQANTIDCLSHLFGVLNPEECAHALVIVKNNRVRIFEFP